MRSLGCRRSALPGLCGIPASPPSRLGPGRRTAWHQHRVRAVPGPALQCFHRNMYLLNLRTTLGDGHPPLYKGVDGSSERLVAGPKSELGTRGRLGRRGLASQCSSSATWPLVLRTGRDLGAKHTSVYMLALPLLRNRGPVSLSLFLGL